MILILERKPNKIPGLSSLFISFNYNKLIVDIIKAIASIKNYNSDTKEWEIPISDLSIILDELCGIDNILLNVLDDELDNNYECYTLSLHKTLPYKYLEEGILYGLSHDKFLLLDAPGLGKSLQVIYLAEELKLRLNIQHCLIICGINTLKANWVKEINTHSSFDCKILGQRTKKNGQIKYGGIKERLEDLKSPIKEFFVITNIETLRSEDIIKALNNESINKFDMIAFDEVHKANNPSALLTKGFLKIKQGSHRVAMTGTLLTSSPLNAYTPLKWLGLEKSTYTNFKYYYCRFSGPFNNILVGYRNIEYLKDQLDRFGLRRTKDILDLPPKTIINEYIDMEDDQKEFYENIVNGIKDLVDKVELNTTNLLAMMGRLRLAADCPSVLTTEKISNAKLNRTLDLVELITGNGDKVVIFDVFKSTLNDLYTELKDYNPLLCTGDIDDAIISDNVDKFQNDNIHNVMLCTSLKMGTGITLTAASYAIFLNTPYTYAEYELALDRIHRISAKDPVFIYNLICKDTVDERVKDIVENKEALSDFIIDDKISPKLKNKLKEIILDLKKV